MKALVRIPCYSLLLIASGSHIYAEQSREDLSTSLVSRIAPMPQDMVRAVFKHEDIRPYHPTPEELGRVQEELLLLPDVLLRTLEERLAAIYFVEEISALGTTRPVMGEDGETLTMAARRPSASKVTAENDAPPPAIRRSSPPATVISYSADSPRASPWNTMRPLDVHRMSGAGIIGA